MPNDIHIQAMSLPLLKMQQQLTAAIQEAHAAGDSSAVRALARQALKDGDTLLQIAKEAGLDRGPTADIFERKQKELAQDWLRLQMVTSGTRKNIQNLDESIKEIDASENQEGLETTVELRRILSAMKADREKVLEQSIDKVRPDGFGS